MDSSNYIPHTIRQVPTFQAGTQIVRRSLASYASKRCWWSKRQGSTTRIRNGIPSEGRYRLVCVGQTLPTDHRRCLTLLICRTCGRRQVTRGTGPRRCTRCQIIVARFSRELTIHTHSLGEYPFGKSRPPEAVWSSSWKQRCRLWVPSNDSTFAKAPGSVVGSLVICFVLSCAFLFFTLSRQVDGGNRFYARGPFVFPPQQGPPGS